MKARTDRLPQLTLGALLLLSTRVSFAATPVANTVHDLCGDTGDCAVTKKFAITDDPAVFDLGARNFHVTASGGLIGNGNEIDIRTDGTVTLDKGSVISSIGKGIDGGAVSVAGSTNTSAGPCTLAGKIQANAAMSAGLGGNGGNVELHCTGAHLTASAVLEAKGVSGYGGSVSLDGDQAAIGVDKGAKLDAGGAGGGGGEVLLNTGGTCGTPSSPIAPKMLASAAVAADVGGDGGSIAIDCEDGIALDAATSLEANGAADSSGGGQGGSIDLETQAGPITAVKGSKASAQGKAESGGTVTINAVGPCVPLALAIQADGKETVNGGGDGGQVNITCNGPINIAKGGKIVAGSAKDANPGTVNISALGQCGGDASPCTASGDCSGSGSCDLAGGHCSVTTGQTCASDPDCPTPTCDSGQCSNDNSSCTLASDCPVESCVGATGTCSGLAIACQTDDDCNTCIVPGFCKDGDGSQCTTQSGPGSCSVGPCYFPGHCTSGDQTCSVDAECSSGTCIPSLQIDNGTTVQNDGSFFEQFDLAISLQSIGPCSANGKLQSDAIGLTLLGPGSDYGGEIQLKCSGVTLGSKAAVETNCPGDTAGTLLVDTMAAVDNGITASACDIGGTITAKAPAISDANGSQDGTGGNVLVFCGTSLNMSAKADASGSNGGQISLAASDASNLSGKLTAKGSSTGTGGEVDVFGVGITTTVTSAIDVSGNLDGPGIVIVSEDHNVVAGNAVLNGSVAAKGSGPGNTGGFVYVEACGVSLGTKATIVSDGATGGTNSLIAHKVLTLDPKAKVSALVGGFNDLEYGQTPAPSTTNVKPASLPLSFSFTGDNCP
ncbi:MAG TPA: hypothetical protein VMW17_20965 [Candidatus Binatia bacterium]|nr:hypothetical protein [Candidatus Binatia bacterium]